MIFISRSEVAQTITDQIVQSFYDHNIKSAKFYFFCQFKNKLLKFLENAKFVLPTLLFDFSDLSKRKESKLYGISQFSFTSNLNTPGFREFLVSTKLIKIFEIRKEQLPLTASTTNEREGMNQFKIKSFCINNENLKSHDDELSKVFDSFKKTPTLIVYYDVGQLEIMYQYFQKKLRLNFYYAHMYIDNILWNNIDRLKLFQVSKLVSFEKKNKIKIRSKLISSLKSYVNQHSSDQMLDLSNNLLKNILKDQFSIKYRRIRSDFKKISEVFITKSGGVDVLKALGFSKVIKDKNEYIYENVFGTDDVKYRLEVIEGFSKGFQKEQTKIK